MTYSAVIKEVELAQRGETDGCIMAAVGRGTNM